MESDQMKWFDWKSCYKESAKGLIVPEAFSHPAKMSIALCWKIISFMEEKGMLHKGDEVVDPFAGIGTTGLIGAMMRYQVWLIELEKKFVDLSNQNIEKNRSIFERMGMPIPVVIQGDSRKLSEIVDRAAGIVTSPPFNENKSNVVHGQTKGFHSYDANESKNRMKRDYQEGQDPANIGKLSIDGIDSIITSPPYGDQRVTSFTNDKERTQEMLKQLRERGHIEWEGKRYSEAEWRAMNHGRIDGRTTRGAKKGETGYAEQTAGQIGSLKDRGIDGVITSPPYESAGTKADENPANYIRRDQERYELMKARGIRRPKQSPGRYSGSRENIGNQNAETYWAAMDVVYRECWKILKPAGWMAVVVKDFVRNKKRVPLCDNTVKLLEHIGFKVHYRARAWLTEDLGTPDVFIGKTKSKERKSFFRRLAEQKGSPRIDFEEVIFAQKKATYPGVKRTY